MHLNCRNCGAEINAGDVNLDRMLAKCNCCNAVFSFDDQFEYADTPEQAYQKFNVEKPRGMQVQAMGGEIKIIRNWFSPVIIFLALFCIVWNGLLLFWFGVAFTSQSWFPAVFVLPHAAVGLGLLYWVLAGIFNITEIQVNGQELSIRHRPLPWPGNKNLFLADISQLYCKEHVTRGRRSSHTTYEVHAVTRDNQRQKLITGLPHTDEALFLEQEIEQFWGIKDRPVQGELVA